MSYTNPLHTPVGSVPRSSYSSLGSAIEPNSSSTRRRVPQTSVVKSKANASNAISFDFIGYPRQGMPLRELCARGPYGLQQMMEGANDPALAHTRLRKITLHISWPGYEHVQWNRSVDVVTSNGPMTRCHLAGVIAQYLSQYIEKAQCQPTRNPDWRLGPRGFSQDHIILLSLYHTYEDAWQVEMAVDFR